MTPAGWRAVIDQAAAVGFRRVTFIGGEPTLNRDLPGLAWHSLQRSLQVSIFSNLMRVPPTIWRLAATPGVRLETSCYSSSADEHDAITGVRGSHALTSASIREAALRGITVHVAIVAVHRGQQLSRARRELRQLGASVSGSYRVRAVGLEFDLTIRTDQASIDETVCAIHTATRAAWARITIFNFEGYCLWWWLSRRGMPGS
jgi:MoaA/NifB/PqqE/SkfB family radical SAM enzyme